MLTKNELKSLWRDYNFRPLKRLGQNFLVDKNIKDKILKNLELNRDDRVIEIGAGFGELTFELAKYAEKVFAIEKDRKIVEILKNAFELPPNVLLIKKDFLDVDINKISQGKRVIVYGNLPYYITSPIIEKLFNSISSIKSIYFVVQDEFARRILATPGSKDIGRISLYVQYYTQPKRLFKIGKGCFYPSPKVESAFLKLEVLKKRKVQVKDATLFFKIIKKTYGKRRKTILNSLSGMGIEKGDLSHLLKSAELNPLARAEDLSLQDLARLSNILLGALGAHERE